MLCGPVSGLFTLTEYVIVDDAPGANAPDHDNVGALYDTVPVVAVASLL